MQPEVSVPLATLPHDTSANAFRPVTCLPLPSPSPAPSLSLCVCEGGRRTVRIRRTTEQEGCLYLLGMSGS